MQYSRRSFAHRAGVKRCININIAGMNFAAQVFEAL